MVPHNHRKEGSAQLSWQVSIQYRTSETKPNDQNARRRYEREVIMEYEFLAPTSFAFLSLTHDRNLIIHTHHSQNSLIYIITTSQSWYPSPLPLLHESSPNLTPERTAGAQNPPPAGQTKPRPHLPAQLPHSPHNQRSRKGPPERGHHQQHAGQRLPASPQRRGQDPR